MTPIAETKENLIVTNTPEEQDNQKKVEDGQLSIEQDNQSSNKLETFTITFFSSRIYAIILCIVLLISSIILYDSIKKSYNVFSNSSPSYIDNINIFK